MTAPHCRTTEEVKANIRRISRNKGCGDNEGPTSIEGGSASNMTTHTPSVEPHGDHGDEINKRGM